MNKQESDRAGMDWHTDRCRLSLLTTWMADHGYDAIQVAQAVAEPWAFYDEYRFALKWRHHPAEVEP